MFALNSFAVAHHVSPMLDTGDTAPTFSATVGTSEHEPFELDDHLGDGPVVLAFFPGAFTPPCTNEMVSLQTRLDEFREAGATVLGVSVDSPFSLGAFRDRHGIEFDLVSDTSRGAIRKYGLEVDLPELGLYGVANRAVFVLDEDGVVAHGWVADDPTDEPDYDDLLEAVKAV